MVLQESGQGQKGCVDCAWMRFQGRLIEEEELMSGAREKG